MKRENRFAAFIRKTFGINRQEKKGYCRDITACMNAMIDQPCSDFEAEYETFRTEYLYG
jgi:hypothetical protein